MSKLIYEDIINLYEEKLYRRYDLSTIFNSTHIAGDFLMNCPGQFTL